MKLMKYHIYMLLLNYGAGILRLLRLAFYLSSRNNEHYLLLVNNDLILNNHWSWSEAFIATTILVTAYVISEIELENQNQHIDIREVPEAFIIEKGDKGTQTIFTAAEYEDSQAYLRYYSNTYFPFKFNPYFQLQEILAVKEIEKVIPGFSSFEPLNNALIYLDIDKFNQMDPLDKKDYIENIQLQLLDKKVTLDQIYSYEDILHREAYKLQPIIHAERIALMKQIVSSLIDNLEDYKKKI